MRSIVLIDGSPKIKESSLSKHLAEMAGSYIDNSYAEKTYINVRQSMIKHITQSDFEKMSEAEAIIITFPLYIFCMPGILTRFLQDYYQFFLIQGKTSNNPKVYAIVNCGFPEPEINFEAVRVIRSFCLHINANFRFGIMIGGGGMLIDALDAPFMKKTLDKLSNSFITIAKDIKTNSVERLNNINITMNFPGWLYLFMASRGWFSMARQNGLKKKELYNKPYL